MQLEKSLAINAHFQLQWEEKQNCFVLLYPEGMVQLSQSAGEIMNLCNGENTTLNITDLLEKKFNLVGLQSDIIEFLEDAMNRKWVIYND
ncbi:MULTISPECIES: pyrroloquinoline quinone biosynthesis peptide chaperone PqqD [Arcobacteraceae]|uniref:Pyrroloquinoline quinone biosynthesis protein PqqD n=1 Tax=Poseidonibacter parvus TaxID=1850254 RepID=A0A1P8KJX5_9BACT|nr:MULTISPECIES: pyrroloquinoline quinone biosynthesis peptide chaperone PqqD [Arcobacteraceae]APW64835.1 pyrroloquinoline quinone biosynthesis protein PqqD [Poseidonibacter parvus]